MPKENWFAGPGEAMEPKSESGAEFDDEQTADEGTTDKSEKSEPEPAVESKSEGDSAPDSKAESDPESDEASESDDAGGGSEVAERNDGDEAEEATESNTEADGAESAADTGQATETVGDPAFEFEATTAKSIYVRTTMLDWLDNVEFEVGSLLCREHDVRDLTGREFHDALVRVTAKYPEEIVNVVLERRNEWCMANESEETIRWWHGAGQTSAGRDSKTILDIGKTADNAVFETRGPSTADWPATINDEVEIRDKRLVSTAASAVVTAPRP